MIDNANKIINEVYQKQIQDYKIFNSFTKLHVKIYFLGFTNRKKRIPGMLIYFIKYRFNFAFLIFVVTKVRGILSFKSLLNLSKLNINLENLILKNLRLQV